MEVQWLMPILHHRQFEGGRGSIGRVARAFYHHHIFILSLKGWEGGALGGWSIGMVEHWEGGALGVEHWEGEDEALRWGSIGTAVADLGGI